MKFSAIASKGYINANELLASTDQLSVWHKILEQYMNIDDKFCNILRGDRSPGCWLQHGIYKTDRIVLNDFGDKRFHGMDIVQAVMFKHQLSYNQALHWIKEEFKVQVRVYDLPPYKPFIQKSRAPISYVPKPFTSKDRDFWKPLGITSKQLFEDEVYSCSYYVLYTAYCTPSNLCYVYNFPSGNKKIYQPFSEKKWINNCTNKDIGQLHLLPKTGDLLVISKSYKDCRILRNLGFNCIWLQNEGILLDTDIANELSERFEHIIFFYDNDSAGIQGGIINMNHCNSVTNTNKFTTTHLPIRLLKEEITDPADLLMSMGLQPGNKILYNLIR
jgi:hypothetical protein